jgi:HEAT repeat protein
MVRLALCLSLICASSGSTWAGICDGCFETSIDGRPVSALVEELEGHDFPAAEAARETLRAHASIALPVIVSIQSSKKYPGHRTSSRRLQQTFAGAADATRALLPGLECSNWKVRESAVLVLGWIGAEAESAIPALVSALEDSFWGVRMQAAFTLRNIGIMNTTVIMGLLERLNDDSASVADAAATALARYPEQTLDAVKAALGASVPRTRRFAARSARKMVTPPYSAFPLLLAMLKDDTIENRLEVVEALRAWEPGSIEEAVPVLIQMLGDADLRCPAARLLALKGGDRAGQALPALVEAVREPEEHPRSCANQAYGDISTIGPAAIPVMIELLDLDDVGPRHSALLALGRIEPQTSGSMAAIAEMLADEELGANARELLVSIGQPSVGLLVEGLAHESPRTRSEAAIGLARIGPDAVDAAPALVRRLADESGEPEKQMIVALGRIAGPKARPAIPLLRAALEDAALRVEAATALGLIAGPAAGDVAPILADALRVQVRGDCPHPTADAALRAIGPPGLSSILDLLADDTFGSAALPLLDALADEALEQARPVFVGWVTESAPSALDGAERLLRLDGAASPAMIEVFTGALDHWNPWRRLRGAEALLQIGHEDNARARAVLEGLLDHEYGQIRARAAEALTP